MSDFHLSSVDGNDGTPPSVSWWSGNQSTYATLAGVLAAATGAGPHRIFVDNAHNESSGAAITADLATAGQEMAILCVTRSTGALVSSPSGTVTVGVNNAALTMFSGANAQNVYVHGVKFVANNGSNSANDIVVCSSTGGVNAEFKKCQFNVPGTGATARVSFGNSNITSSIKPRITLDDCSVQLASNASASAGILLRSGRITIRNGLAITFTGTKPATCFSFDTTCDSDVTIQDCDLSGYDNASGYYFTVDDIGSSQVRLVNCKISSAVLGFINGTWPAGNVADITGVNVDSGDTKNKFFYYNRLGSITVDTGIYRTGGSTFDGTGISWKIVTNAACSEHQPFYTPWGEKWIEALTSQTFKMQIVHDSATNLTDRNFWGELEYVSSSTFPIGTVATDRNASPFLGSAVDQATSSETWNGTGGFTNPNKQEAGITVTPSEKSLGRWRLGLGIASKTIYLCRNLSVT